MATNNSQRNFPLPKGSQEKRSSAQHLPSFFRTEVNNKFLSSTVDQLIQPGTAEKVNGYFGRKQAKAFTTEDFYIGDVSKQREDYQLEPAAIVTDQLGNVQFYADYNDYINQLHNLGGDTQDHSDLNEQEYYAWNPHIDWDKFANFREYYWLPNGPQPVPVAGNGVEIESTYTVSVIDNLDNYGFVFTPDGITQDPELRLYRGVTYRFEIDTPGVPLSFRTQKTTAKTWTSGTFYTVGETVQYKGSIYVSSAAHRSEETFEADADKWTRDSSFNLVDEVSQQGIEKGTIELTLNQSTPDYIYYVSDRDINAGGLIRVYDQEEAAFIDVQKEILGKKNYVTGNGFELSNGQKIFFQGTTFPETYQSGFYYVEGVGEAIQLIDEDELTLASRFVNTEKIEFDSEGFDTVPYSTAIGFPRDKDYITINRTAINGNLWSKYNRWFHRSIIEKAAGINGTELIIDQSQRATRPIIEFEANLKLFNFGTQAKKPVDLVDDFTVDVFSIIEGQSGYNIDGVDLADGMRVLFTHDTDIRVKGKIYEVEFITFKGNRQIALRPSNDTEPKENETVFVGQGNTYIGTTLYYDGKSWQTAQPKTSQNQAPLFDVFNCNGESLADRGVYPSTDFEGTELFSYQKGTGPTDEELGFPLSYRSIENVGDLVFEFDLLRDSAAFCPEGEKPKTESTGAGYLRRFNSRTEFTTENGWKIAEELSFQPVVRQYEAHEGQSQFEIDVYNDSSSIENLSVKVYINNSFTTDYSIDKSQNNAKVVFDRPLKQNDVVRFKTRANAAKNLNGFYEIPINLERNPLNEDVGEITLGEVNDHVSTIIEELSGFAGDYPGVSNLRDLGTITQYGKRIVRHSAPVNLSLYHTVDRSANAVKAVRFAKQEYAKLKREFLQLARDLPDSGDVRKHTETILRQITKNKKQSDPFYFSDMVPAGGATKNSYLITSDQQTFFALSQPFTLNSLSDRAVLVYLNSVQLVYSKDYTFNSEGFIQLNAGQANGDTLEVFEYDTTAGSFVPPTPAKLGLFPTFLPEKVLDDTYLEPVDIIIGHDGSKTVAFNDFRDDLLLELEKRIYNNIKVEYNSKLFDIYDYVPGIFRDTGIPKDILDTALNTDFAQWLRLVDADFTENPVYNRSNSFTWNHTGMTNWRGDPISGSWRAVYLMAYDTDSPHSKPWEMLGFTEKPEWWDIEYGPAPYTKGNLLLWEDIEQGIIREPGKAPQIKEQFSRPGLTGHLPVDDKGDLVSPMASGYVGYYNDQLLDRLYQFGDWSPVETAWRRSSEYSFALLAAFLLNRPSKVFATGFDRSRQFRDLAGQISYEEPNRQIRLTDLKLPNTPQDAERTFTSGIVNWVRDYITSNVTSIYDDYRNQIKAIDNQIGFKLGGFTTKDKFKLILDSRTPSNKGNVFVPEENYKIFLNTSSPVENIFYSGVIIEKRPSGFTVRGYNEQQPSFSYYKPLETNADPIETIGGISASVIVWDSNKTLTKGKVVEYENSVYRVSETHQTTSNFDQTKFVKIPQVPIEGGRTAKFRSRFDAEESQIRYGESFLEIQDVVDFLLGYGAWLEDKGFSFDYYYPETGFVTDWKTSAREFLFWTTQNWKAGAVIALSPAGFRFRFRSESATVDDIYDTFFGYSLTKADGKKLQPENVSVTREKENEFSVRTKNTADGIFGIRISLIQKEHAVIIDNKTVFGDIIYDQEPGYRQERIRVLGYRTSDWNGSINVPGFVYDDARAEEWKPWRDYAIGDIVNYKEFYYAAGTTVPGAETFDAQNWFRLDEKPQAGLLPNWEYKTNQFADFYDLDTDNFDAEQQKFAQHLIGYQNRQYLANIINDDVSQYKFYQGFIQDKGTQNALTKLFDVLGSANRDSLEFFEEWAIKSSQYGATAGFEEVEFVLDENKFRTEPQHFELVQRLDANVTDLVYRITPSEVYQTPENYNHSPFPQKTVIDTFTKTSGYVHPDDVEFKLDSYDDLIKLDYSSVKRGDIIWAGIDGQSWSVYTHVQTDYEIESVVESANGFTINLTTAQIHLKKDEIIGIFNLGNVDGIYRINSIENNSIELLAEDLPKLPEGKSQGRITRFENTRFADLTEANLIVPEIDKGISRIWVDNTTDNEWKVYDKVEAFTQSSVQSQETTISDQFASSIDSDEANRIIVVGSPDEGNGKVYIYTRSSESDELLLNSVIFADDDLAEFGQRFGASVAIDQRGRYIAIGSPNASGVKSLFAGNFEETRDYLQSEIVSFADSFWQALVDIQGSTPSIQFGSFQSVPQILIDLGLISQSSEKINTLLAGNYPFTNLNTVDHFLVKAPREMFEAAEIGDDIELKWNQNSYAHQSYDSLDSVSPFEGTITALDENFISRRHTISDKIDSILRFETSDNIPDPGQIIETQTAFATVAYVYEDAPSDITVYVKKQNGDFGDSGSASTRIGEFVGEYVTVAPVADTVDIDNYWQGYFKINTSFTFNVGEIAADEGRGLIYSDLIPQGDSDHGYYFNILDFETTTQSSNDSRNSEIITLTYEGTPGPRGVEGFFESSLWVARAPSQLTGDVASTAITPLVDVGDSVDLFFNSLRDFKTNAWKDPNTVGLSVSDITGSQIIVDVWDGYIDFEIQNDYQGQPVEPKVGLTVKDADFGGTADVVFYQKFDNNFGRVFVKNVTGRWALGDEYGESRSIEYLADGSGDPEYDPASGSRVIGNIQSRSIGLASAGIGKLLVFDKGNSIEFTGTSSLLNSEYWFYNEQTVNGSARPANTPSTSNNDWIQVYRLPAGAGGSTIGPNNEGLYSIYERSGANNWTRIGAFITPDRTPNQKLGSFVDLTSFADIDRLFVSTKDNTVDTGKVWIIKNGEENSQSFSWELGINKRYTGIHSHSKSYREGDIVFLAGSLYRAETAIKPKSFDVTEWQTLQDPIDYLGYVPNNTGLVLSENSILDQTGLISSTREIAVSDTGEVLALSIEYTSDVNKVAIYRNVNGLFVLTEVISAETPESKFGASVSLSTDGTYLAIGAPEYDTINLDQGVVYIYKQSQSVYSLSQILQPARNGTALRFGSEIDFDGTTLAVTADNGDSVVETEFDGGITLFDQGLTRFRDTSSNAGTISIYENVAGSWLYGQTIDYDDPNTSYFGRTVFVQENHIYAGLPYLSTEQANGIFVDFRKPKNSSVWTERRSIKPSVDVEKIKQVILYDRKENVLSKRLDFIDVNQGKIPGPAEQEIEFKLYHDPAVYTTGESVQIDKTNSWGEDQKGKVWWDLSKARFLNPYQDSIIYSGNNWNVLFSPQSTIEIWEWVESDITPDEWDRLSGSELGLARGISGTTRYGNQGYTEKRSYSRESKTFNTKYYFWVKDKVSKPQVNFRNLSVNDIAKLIADPQGQGYQFVALVSPTQWALYNCGSLVKGRDIALSIQYWTIPNQTINIHNQYEIVTDGLSSSVPTRDIEQKWFDSLVGFDLQRRPVPAPELSVKEKYGSLNRPRQSWFVNRIEALYQVIERVNKVLKQNLIVDEKDISRLTEAEAKPVVQTGKYDRTVESELDLELLGTARISQAAISVVTKNGKIIRANIDNQGRGYQNPPRVVITGTGIGAEIQTQIDNQGRVISASVTDAGEEYNSNTQAFVRPFSVLVENDSELEGRWAIYQREDSEWRRVESQGYDVGRYWSYQDWYAKGYSQFSEINWIVEAPYELQTIDDNIGDIVKIQSVGTGGWLLLEKEDDQTNVDYTVNYKTVGRQNGTIQFADSLWDVEENLAGYDATTFDDTVYDAIPSREIRIILETVRDELFVDELALEYNQLFFSSLRYVFSEQNYVDWAFKTSFIKAQHNVGDLEQKITFRNDNLPNYEDYVKEVKPFKTKIREYLSSYERSEGTNSIITDFDLAPRFNIETGKIEPFIPKVRNNSIIAQDITEPPQQHWLDTVGFSIEKIAIADAGEGYTAAPFISITGGGGQGAKAVASIGRGGKITSIAVTDSGSGYISAPTVNINGSIRDGGKVARASAQLGGSPVRSTHSQIKFDRVSGTFVFENTETDETFVASGTKFDFDLEWPMDLRPNKVSVFVDGTEVLGGQYTYTNIPNEEKSRERYNGRISFNQAPPANRTVKVVYHKNADLLDAQDRINLFYQPSTGQLGKDLGQLMEGIDYGGVQVNSYDFGGTVGWDADPWFTKSWDIYDTVFEDEVLYRKRVTLEFTATIVPEAYGLDGARIIQDSTEGIGYIESIGDTSITVECSVGTQFNSTDHVRIKLEDSTEGAIFFEDSSLAIPTSVVETVYLERPLDSGVTYTIYLKEFDTSGNTVRNVRLDDPDFGTADQTNNNAVTQSIEGDGSTTELVLGDYAIDSEPSQTGNTTVIIFRKITSDGAFIPDPDTVDSIVTGGDLAYQTATGVKAEDIIVDGDGFVTPTTSSGPEELVPGQVIDTLDIQVYERPNGGASQIVHLNYLGTGSQSQFSLNTTPVKQENVFVKVNGLYQSLNEDFYVNYGNLTVDFVTAPQQNDRVAITVLGHSSLAILAVDQFEGDGDTKEFVTDLRYNEGQQAFVTVNGETEDFVVFETDDSYELPGNTAIRFDLVPFTGSVISVLITDNSETSAETNWSETRIEQFVSDGSTQQFTLSSLIFEQQPALAHTIVQVGDKILTAGYSQLFEIVEGIREYQLDLNQVPVGSATFQELEVYLNGVKLNQPRDYIFEAAGKAGVSGSRILLTPGVGESGDELKVYTLSDGEYRFGFFDVDGEFVSTRGEDSFTPTLYLDNPGEAGDIIKIYSFSNHDSQGIERYTLEINQTTQYLEGSQQYYEYRRLANGVIPLRKPATDAQWVWIAVNGIALDPSVDYWIANDRQYVNLIKEPKEGDIIDVFHLAETPTTEQFGWRQFKDMLNRTHYKRLGVHYELASDLNWWDSFIEVTDASQLPEPDRNTKFPGVIFLDGERIEYFIKDGNMLKQIRRGTLGTGVKELYPKGTKFTEQSTKTSIPYSDRDEVQTYQGTGTKTEFHLPFAADSVNDIEVFVGGKRLRKTQVSVFNPLKAQDSPEGDVTQSAQFSVTNNQLVLVTAPREGETVTIVRRIGSIWSPQGIPFSESETDIARFLQSAPTDLPR